MQKVRLFRQHFFIQNPNKSGHHSRISVNRPSFVNSVYILQNVENQDTREWVGYFYDNLHNPFQLKKAKCGEEKRENKKPISPF